jgi:hypothetical protein
MVPQPEGELLKTAGLAELAELVHRNCVDLYGFRAGSVWALRGFWEKRWTVNRVSWP